ncbi:MAG: hypothetical protein V1921_06145 [Candidatus Altiarchaeota archaeon]
MASIIASFGMSLVIVMSIIYIAACSAYILDFCVRLVSKDRYGVISRMK